MKKKILISMLLVLVFLTLSVSPTLAADIQAAYAKIPQDLLDAFDEVGSKGTLDVVVWVEDNSTEEYQSIVSNIPEPTFETTTPDTASYGIQAVSETGFALSDEERAAQIEAMQNYIMQKRQIAQAVYLEDNTAIANELAESGGDIVYISKYSPLVICNVTLSEAVDMAMNDSVLSLENGNVKIENNMATSSSAISVPYAQNLFPNCTAAGVKIGMVEPGNPNFDYACFDGYIDGNRVSVRESEDADESSPYYDDFEVHASLVAAIMIGKNSGIARDFEHFYSAGVLSKDEIYEATEWLLDNGVNVINYSMGIVGEETTEYNDLAKWFDHIAYNHSVHCVLSSGNSHANKVNNMAMAYNVITVGNIDDRGTISRDDDLIWATLDIETGIVSGSAYNDTKTDVAYKPDLCAPGCSIDIPDVENFYYFYNPHYKTIDREEECGTSYSAPHVSGVVAILCSRYPTLLTKQALVKSILLSSVSTDTDHRYDTRFQADGKVSENYRKYGSGIVNAHNAIELIESGNYVNYSLPASEGDKIYSLGNLTAGQTVTITLTYLKRVRYASADHTNTNGDIRESFADLDLHVFNAVGYVYGTDCTKTSNIIKSITTNSNVEKIVFTVTAPGPHLIYIDKYAGQDPYDVIFGLSWMIDDSSLQ